MPLRPLQLPLVVLALVAYSLSGCATARNQPAPPQSRPTIVLVHGAWGGSWAFREVDSLLSERGYKVYRPSLTGLGERVHLAEPDVGLGTHIEDVVNVLRFEELDDVILAGHSYGGMVITGVADRVPDRIRRLVYVDAFVPANGESVMSIQGARGEWIRQMVQGDLIVPPWVNANQPFPRDVPQPIKTFTEPLVLGDTSARVIPATYVLTVEEGKEPESDDFAAQAERARERGWTVRQLPSDHNPQWSAPEALVGMLVDTP